LKALAAGALCCLVSLPGTLGATPRGHGGPGAPSTPTILRLAALVPAGRGALAPQQAAEALARCKKGDFSQTPLPESSPHVSPAGDHFRDLGYVSLDSFPTARRQELAPLTTAQGNCVLITTRTGPVVITTRDVASPLTLPPTEDAAIQKRLAGLRRMKKLRTELIPAAMRQGFPGGSLPPPSGGVTEDLGNGRMVALKGGAFWTGSTEQELEERRALYKRYIAPHRGGLPRDSYEDEVRLPAQVASFAMDRREVPVGDFRVFIQATGFGGVTLPPRGQRRVEKLPVTGVTLAQAMAYCAWRGARLPTALEWEFAARGTGSRRWAWGPSPPDGRKANFCDKRCGKAWANPDHDDGHAGLAQVGSYPAGATPEGLLDMAGNAREWTSTLTPDGRSLVKGGGHDNAIDDLLPADVRANRWDRGIPDIGFRCAAALP